MTLPNYLRKFFQEPEPLDLGDFLPPELDDKIEYIEEKDLVEVKLPGALMAFYGTILRVREDIQYALVDCCDGAQRWASINELELILKGSALIADESALSA